MENRIGKKEIPSEDKEGSEVTNNYVAVEVEFSEHEVEDTTRLEKEVITDNVSNKN